MTEPAPKPGWYPDPNTGRRRWFDGTTWGPGEPPPAATAEEKPKEWVPAPAAQNVVVLGYVFALLLSPIGLMIGFYCMNHRNAKTRMHGGWILALSVIGSVWLVAVLVNEGLL